MLSAPTRGVHLLSVARSEVERRSILSNWIVSALRDGSGFVYAEPDETPTVGSVTTALAHTGLDLERARGDGRLLRVPMADFYAVGAPAMVVARATAEGFPGVRIAADARHGLAVLDEPTYLQFERSLADTCSVSPLSALCQFDTDAAGSWFSEVSWLHSGSGPASPFLAIPNGDGVALFGEVDISNQDSMFTALGLAADHSGRVLTVDLGGLRLLAAAGCRALIEATDDFRARGGQVVLLGARPQVERVLALLGFDHAPGFSMGGESP